MSERIVILGAASAIAQALARRLAAEGAELVLVGRRAERLEEIAADLRARGAGDVSVVAADLANAGSAADALAAWAGERPLGAVYLFYGVLTDQTCAETDLDYARETLEVNFTSAALWALAAAERLEAQRRGVLVVVGSVAGDRGRQSNYVYGAAKAGLATLVQGIAHRLALRGGEARAVLVKPGFVDTPMTDHLPKGGPLWAQPDAVARIIRQAADGKAPVVYAPPVWRLILLVLRLVPAPIFHRARL